MSPLHVHGLDRFVDEVHAQFDAWTDAGALETALGPDGATVLRLAVHEWVANLVQHAEFCDPATLTLTLDVRADSVRCCIEDSSRGFDFVTQVGAQQSHLDEPFPSERGRGLLMLVSCAQNLDFAMPTAGTPQRIAFTVTPPGDDTFAALFRPEDLILDAPPTGFSGDGATAALVSPSDTP